MKIDPFQCIAVCTSVKHFTSFLLLKGLAISKAVDKCHKKIHCNRLASRTLRVRMPCRIHFFGPVVQC